jgi:hypothetical protein
VADPTQTGFANGNDLVIGRFTGEGRGFVGEIERVEIATGGLELLGPAASRLVSHPVGVGGRR